MAMFLKMAFPPIVNEAIVAVIINPTQKTFKSKFLEIDAAIVTPAEPDIIPHISPITSLQNDDTLAAFFLNDTAFFAPFIFLELMECNGSSSAEVTATPIISKIIPMMININSISIPVRRFTLGMVVSDINENISEIIKASPVTIRGQLFLFAFFFIYFPFFINKKGPRTLINKMAILIVNFMS